MGIISPGGLAGIDGVLYLVGVTTIVRGVGDSALYTVNTSTGVATRVGSATHFGVGEDAATGLAAF